MNIIKKIPVTLFIGEKNFVQKKVTKTGYKRHYESAFFENLKEEVDFDVKYLYPWKGSRYSSLRHLANHILHSFIYRREFKKNRIKHIMFAEEAFMLNFLPPENTVVSCLDVIPLVLPSEASTRYKIFIDRAYKGMKRASIVIANSYYTKSDIVKHLGVSEEKIHVAYPPVGEIFKPVSVIPDAFYKKYNLDKGKKYILYVGALDLPRKNIKTILKAFSLINKEHEDVRLLLVGYTTLKGESANFGENVRVISDVSDDDLVLFYNLAEIFLFPSLYEGFGLPPLEAMRCGTPVIASNVSSILEVLGDAAFYVDPLDYEEIACRAELLLSDKKLRDKKTEEGLSQAKKYSWDSYCKDTLKAYKVLFKG